MSQPLRVRRFLPSSASTSPAPALPWEILREIRRVAGLAVILAALALPLATNTPALADDPDTTWVRTYDHDFYNWATPHDSTFVFPDTSLHVSKILMFYRIECPAAPGDCDPWDRIGYLRLGRETGRTGEDGVRELEWIEIGRVVTPYDITPPPRPVSCTWEIDVTDYMQLLRGDVLLSNYIETWIGDARGWIVTIDFAFVHGEPDLIPYEVTNLWSSYWTLYGDPDDDIENHFAPITVPVTGAPDAAKARIFCTGHGQGNTANCAEFCNRWHQVTANGTVFQHNLWRSNCAQNSCSPQGGTWTYNRAGWCPGDAAPAWEVDLTEAILPGADNVFDYNVQPYVNYCRPSNPACVDGQTCTDCDYNYNGHTPPIYILQGHVVLYRRNPASSVPEDGGVLAPPARAPIGLRLDGSHPNPFERETAIAYAIEAPGTVAIRIHDAGGRIVRAAVLVHESAGAYTWAWDGTGEDGRPLPAGVYFYAVRAGDEYGARKMLLLK